jgi:hypothetical protein
LTSLDKLPGNLFSRRNTQPETNIRNARIKNSLLRIVPPALVSKNSYKKMKKNCAQRIKKVNKEDLRHDFKKGKNKKFKRKIVSRYLKNK